jgi:hypothetical protein
MGSFLKNWGGEGGGHLDTRPGLWNIDTNDLMAGGRVHKNLPCAFRS